MAYTIRSIAAVINGRSVLSHPEVVIEHLLFDSRKLVFPENSLFFAINSDRNKGTDFIPELFDRGLKNFVVPESFDYQQYVNANFIVADDTVTALQKLAAHHRRAFTYPVIGITGSNGKTMVKEWLNQLLHIDHDVVRSPKSYNSQIGVPLSVWQMKEQHTLAIFEAGISKPGEMRKLQEVICPTIGLLTTIGEAHSEGFTSNKEKALEKLQLFKDVEIFVYPKDVLLSFFADEASFKNLFSARTNFFSWSRMSAADLQILNEKPVENSTEITALYKHETVIVSVPFTDKISVDNAISCWCIMLILSYQPRHIAERMAKLASVDMRMQLKKVANNCTLINDSYSNDLSSFPLALDYLVQQRGNKQATVILSDIYESGFSSEQLFESITQQVKGRSIDKLILIGEAFSRHEEHAFPSNDLLFQFYRSTADFLSNANTHQFRDEVILLKGARKFQFERISRWFEEKLHQTVMEVNLTAMIHNLKQYQQLLRPSTKIMAMVKAFSYGSGTAEVARVLQYNKVDYLAVAYADEGVELRKAGIHMPIMVMNAEKITFDSLVEYDLEPELYSFNIISAFNNYLNEQAIPVFPVHIKIDTGMHRLGFEIGDADQLIGVLQQHKRLKVTSVFTHLVGSEEAELDDFTQQQYEQFNHVCNKIEKAIGYSFTRHLSNTAAIVRHRHLQHNMVRLGIGLYGVQTSGSEMINLHPVATLTSTIAQVRQVKAGESIGYNRKGIVNRDSVIATIRLGYADGFSRRLSNGVGSVFVNGVKAPVVGNVCMDMTMIDITGIEGVSEGDKVEVFGNFMPIQEVAKAAGTISYEILTGISQRVKRVYYEE